MFVEPDASCVLGRRLIAQRPDPADVAGVLELHLCPVRVSEIQSGTAFLASMQAFPKPTDLATVIDLILCHMEPCPVSVELWCRHQGVFKPCVITLRQSRERNLTGLVQVVHVRLQLSLSDLSPPFLAQLECCRPRFRLGRPWLAFLEGEDLVRAFHRSRMRKQGSDRVASRVVQVIEFVARQAFDRRKQGLSSVREHANQSTDGRRVTWKGRYATGSH